MNEQLRAAAMFVAVAAVAAAVVVFLAVRHRPVAVSAPVRTDISSALPSAAAGTVTVDVEGKVHRPGLVSLPVGSRVSDAIHAAGGIVLGTSLDGLNLARKVTDGEQIVVGAPASTVAPARTGSASNPARALNLNSATLAELDQLPGVGPVMAQRILDWRTAHGQFASVDQLHEIQGIGERTFARLKDLVTV